MASGWTLLAGFAGGLTIASLFQSIRDLSQPAIAAPSAEAAAPPDSPDTAAAPLNPDLEQRLLNAELQTALAEFQAGYLARAAHELRSPLSTLMSLNQLILADLCESPAEERAAVQRSQIAAKRLLQLLDQLIVVSQWQSGRLPLRPEPLAIAPVLTRLQTVLQPIASGRNLVLHWPKNWADLPSVISDRQALEQCLLHWLQAAIAAPGCTQVTFQIHPQAADVVFDIDHDSPAWSETLALTQNRTEQGLEVLMGQQLLTLLQGQLELLTTEAGRSRLRLRLLGGLAIAPLSGSVLVAEQAVATADQDQEKGAVGQDPNTDDQETAHEQ